MVRGRQTKTELTVIATRLGMRAAFWAWPCPCDNQTWARQGELKPSPTRPSCWGKPIRNAFRWPPDFPSFPATPRLYLFELRPPSLAMAAIRELVVWYLFLPLFLFLSCFDFVGGYWLVCLKVRMLEEWRIIARQSARVWQGPAQLPYLTVLAILLQVFVVSFIVDLAMVIFHL